MFKKPEPKDILLLNKRVQICDRNLRILYRMARLGDTKECSLEELFDIHAQLAGEIMNISTVNGSWELKAMLNQLNTVTESIREAQRIGYKPTLRERIKSVLNRFKISRLFTIITI